MSTNNNPKLVWAQTATARKSSSADLKLTSQRDQSCAVNDVFVFAKVLNKVRFFKEEQLNDLKLALKSEIQLLLENDDLSHVDLLFFLDSINYDVGKFWSDFVKRDVANDVPNNQPKDLPNNQPKDE